MALGAGLIAPRRSDLAHRHRGVGEGEELSVGDLTLTTLETPGHTPEHAAYLLGDGSTPSVLFSAGTLMAGGVARPDLITPDVTDSLARAGNPPVAVTDADYNEILRAATVT